MSVQNLRPLSYRTLFISDVHLGSRGCQAGMLLDFLRSVRCETLYLVGDIIDFWSLERSFYWPQEHNDVVRTVLGMARHGTRVIYVPGNHDELFRDHLDTVFGNVEIRGRSVHRTADGRRLLVLHGDRQGAVLAIDQALGRQIGRAHV